MIMRTTFEHCTKARLSFSGRPHAPVNMADGMSEKLSLALVPCSYVLRMTVRLAYYDMSNLTH